MEDFDGWVATVAPRLHRSAYLLTGDWALAQDLVQHACAQTWPRFTKVASPEAYARTVMVRTATSWWRRKWHGEVPTQQLPEQPTDPWGDVERRVSVQRALRELPAKQRAVIVLRFYEDLSEADIAEALGWPVGTVKSTAARAMTALRAHGLEDIRS